MHLHTFHARRFAVDTAIPGSRGFNLQLALLAPDIVETILAGEETSGLSLDQLTKNLPESWQEQRERFGFRSDV